MTPKKIGIALSGGGVRAAAYHAGVFKYLAEKKCIEQIHHISSVSGGSLFVGLVLKYSGYKSPTSQEYLDTIYPAIKKVLTRTSLQTSSILRLIFNPFNWRFLLTRANITAETIEKLWLIEGVLGDLPAVPAWSINATTAENGRRFRFKGTQVGDFELGYAEANDIKIARAIAVSAAFPGGIGPLTFPTGKYKWAKKVTWNSSASAEPLTPKYKHIHLYDGGIYDNLGIEPLFDIGAQKIKQSSGVDMVIACDAGTAYAREKIPGVLNPKRILRIADIIQDQTRSLRVRSLVNFSINNPGFGFYLQIGSNAALQSEKYCATNSQAIRSVKSIKWLPERQVLLAATYRTSLNRMSEKDFDLIAQHGYETAQWNDLAFNMT